MFLLLFLVILGISYGSVLLISTTAAYLMHKPFPSLCPYTLPSQVLLKTSSVLKHSLMSLSHSITSIQSFPSAVPWDWVLDPNCPQTSSEHLLCGEAKTFVSGMLSFFLLWVIIKDDSSQQDYLQMTWKQGELVLTALLAEKRSHRMVQAESEHPSLPVCRCLSLLWNTWMPFTIITL